MITTEDRAVIAYDKLVDFLVKAELDRDILPRLLDLILEGYQEESGNGNLDQSRMLDSARQYVFDLMNTDVNGNRTNTESYPQHQPKMMRRGLDF